MTETNPPQETSSKGRYGARMGEFAISVESRRRPRWSQSYDRYQDLVSVILPTINALESDVSRSKVREGVMCFCLVLRLIVNCIHIHVYTLSI